MFFLSESATLVFTVTLKSLVVGYRVSNVIAFNGDESVVWSTKEAFDALESASLYSNNSLGFPNNASFPSL